MRKNWMLYGTGTTGVLIAEEAVRRGHRPLLAGRNPDAVAPLARRLGLPWLSVPLDDEIRLRQAVSTVGAVLNVAGPFGATARPLVQACLAAGTHYLDVANEIPSHTEVFAHDRVARERNVVLIAGVGFGVSVSNALAVYVASQVPGATSLEVAVMASNRQESAGAAKSTLDAIAGGGWVYRDGHLVPWRLGSGLKTLRFPDAERSILPIPSGDLEAAYRATKIPNVTVFAPFRPAAASLIPLVRWMISVKAVRHWMEAGIDKRAVRKAADAESHTSYAWARAANDGQQAEAWLELGEGYGFTAASSVRAMEYVERNTLAGALTPAQAFGPDFVLEIEGVRRWSAPPQNTLPLKKEKIR